MKIKAGAAIAGLHIKMRHVLINADAIWKEHGRELVITAGLDGEHSAGSLHYYGMAVDCRTKYFTKEQIKVIAEELRNALGSEYNVIVEATHIHIEWDAGKLLG